MIRRFKALFRKVFDENNINRVKQMRSKYRKFVRKLQPPIKSSDLVKQLQGAGIATGDTLVVHSSMGSLGNLEKGANTVIEALLSAVGSEGNIVMPAYVGLQNSLKSAVVDLRTTPCVQGAIPETFRKMDGVYRSSHPFSSFCAWGKNAEYLTEGHHFDNRICHKDSPLARLMEFNGKILGLGVDMSPISFYHVIEDTWDGYPFDPYDVAQNFEYLDFTGQKINRPVRFYNRKYTATRIETDDNIWLRNYITDQFDSTKIRKHFKFGRANSWSVDSMDFYNLIKDLALNKITIYTTKQEYTKNING